MNTHEVGRPAADRGGKGNRMTDARGEDHATASSEEQQALNEDELKMTNMARHPELGELSDQELSDLISRLRSRLDAAKAGDNAGSRGKDDFLDAALERAMTERQSRGQGEEDGSEAPDDAKPSQHDLAQKAMALKEAGATEPNAMMEDGAPLHPNDPDASEGKGSMADTARRTAPSGALDHAGELPSRERSRTRY
jgi:hypothetical protein